MFCPLAAAARSADDRGAHAGLVAARAPGLQRGDLLGLDLRGRRHDQIVAGHQRRRIAFRELVDADDDLLAALDRLEPARVGFDELALEIAGLDRRDRAAHRVDRREFRLGFGLQRLDARLDLLRAVENVAEFQQVRLIGHDLLQPQRPLLIERARQSQRLVPGGKLHGARARGLREHDGEHLDEDAIGVVFRLLLGQAQRIDLHAVTETPLGGIGDAVALARDLVPELDEGAHLRELGDEAHAGVDEERKLPDDVGKARGVDLAGLANLVENRDRRRQRIAQLLHRRRARFLQMVGADVHRVPLRRLARTEQDEVLGEPQRRPRRKDIGAARKIFLDDVVLRRALQRGSRGALLVGDGDVKRHQPRRGGVDGHRGVHRRERDIGEQLAHVADMRNRDADLADLAARERMVAVIAGLGRQIEGDGKPGLALGEVRAVKAVGFDRGGMAGVGAENPRLVAFWRLGFVSVRRQSHLPVSAKSCFVQGTIAENALRRQQAKV